MHYCAADRPPLRGFERQHNDTVSSSLRQNQTVDVILKIAQAKESIDWDGPRVKG